MSCIELTNTIVLNANGINPVQMLAKGYRALANRLVELLGEDQAKKFRLFVQVTGEENHGW